MCVSICCYVCAFIAGTNQELIFMIYKSCVPKGFPTEADLTFMGRPSFQQALVSEGTNEPCVHVQREITKSLLLTFTSFVRKELIVCDKQRASTKLASNDLPLGH